MRDAPAAGELSLTVVCETAGGEPHVERSIDEVDRTGGVKHLTRRRDEAHSGLEVGNGYEIYESADGVEDGVSRGVVDVRSTSGLGSRVSR